MGTMKKYKNNISIIYNKDIIIILSYIYILLSISLKNKKFIYDSEIIITINGRGNQPILNNYSIPHLFHSNTDETLKFEYKPSEILVNDIKINNVDFYVYNLTEEENNITIKFNETIADCNVMFCNLNNIIKIDFTNFDSSKVTNMGHMFYNCNNLKSLVFNNFNTSSVINMNDMFRNCINLISLDLSDFDTSSTLYLNTMFCNCSKLTSLDVSNFKTSSTIRMEHMFYGCSSLISLDLSNFDTSSVTQMYKMFYECKNLIRINLNNFNTSSVNDMSRMFYGCNKLISLDLSNFDSSSVTSFDDMFQGCNSELIYCINNTNNKQDKLKDHINNNNYSFKNNNNCSDVCFYKYRKLLFDTHTCVFNCNDKYKYEYKNICYINSCPQGTYNFYNNEYLCTNICENYYNYNKTSCIERVPEGYFLNDSTHKTIDKCQIKCKNCTYESNKYNLCISCNNEEGYYEKENDIMNNNSFINCYNNLSEGYFLNKEINIYQKCYDNCKICNESGDIFNNKCIECFSNYHLINNNCYKICDFNYYFNSDRHYKCTENNSCPNEYKNIIEEKKQCINNCSNDDIYKYEYNNKCYISYPNETNISNNICNTNDIENEYSSILNIFKLSGYYYELSSDMIELRNKFNNITFIEIKPEIRKLLINKFNLNEKDNLYIFINEYENHEYKIATLNYSYKFVLGDGTELNKNEINENIYAKVFVPLKDLNLCHFDYYLYFKEQGYDIYDKNSNFYNDICSPAHLYERDIILKDRRTDIFSNNIIICKENCNYEGINLEEKRFICNCNLNIISEIIVNKDKLLNEFIDIKNSIDLNVFKCYKNVFN